MEGVLDLLFPNAPLQLSIHSQFADRSASFALTGNSINVRMLLDAFPSVSVSLPPAVPARIDLSLTGTLSQPAGLDSIHLTVASSSGPLNTGGGRVEFGLVPSGNGFQFDGQAQGATWGVKNLSGHFLPARKSAGTDELMQLTVAAEELFGPVGPDGLSVTLNHVGLVSKLISGLATGPKVESVLTVDHAALFDAHSVCQLELDRSLLKPIHFSYDLTQREGRVQFQWPLQAKSVLMGNGYINLKDSVPAGYLVLTCDEVEIDESHALNTLLAESGGWNLRGLFSLNGSLTFREGQILPKVTVATKNAALSNERFSCVAEGISGAITFTEFAPLTTPGNQEIKIERLQLGKLLFERGRVVLRLASDPESVLIEQAEWSFLGGRVYSQSLRIDPAQPRMDIRLFANGLDMNQLLGLALGEGGSGEGALYGMIPASISLTNPADCIVGEGFLYSSTGSGTWTLGESKPTQIIQRAIEQQLEIMFQNSTQPQARNSMISALRDFEYSLFKLDFIRKNQGILARVTAKGHSRNQAVPVEFEELVLDFPGFDQTLRNLMIIKTEIDKSWK